MDSQVVDEGYPIKFGLYIVQLCIKREVHEVLKLLFVVGRIFAGVDTFRQICIKLRIVLIIQLCVIRNSGSRPSYHTHFNVLREHRFELFVCMAAGRRHKLFIYTILFF